jgi:hypothetical protein
VAAVLLSLLATAAYATMRAASYQAGQSAIIRAVYDQNQIHCAAH